MKTLKNTILLALLAISLGSQADNSIEDKINCAANAIVFNLMFADEDNPELPSQKERIAVWNDAIIKKLIELGKNPIEAKNILKDAVKKSRTELAEIYKDESKTKSEQKEKFDNWWIKATGCIKKYSKKPKSKEE